MHSSVSLQINSHKFNIEAADFIDHVFTVLRVQHVRKVLVFIRLLVGHCHRYLSLYTHPKLYLFKSDMT